MKQEREPSRTCLISHERPKREMASGAFLFGSPGWSPGGTQHHLTTNEGRKKATITRGCLYFLYISFILNVLLKNFYVKTQGQCCVLQSVFVSCLRHCPTPKTVPIHELLMLPQNPAEDIQGFNATSAN